LNLTPILTDKLKKILPSFYCLIFRSYFENCFPVTKVGSGITYLSPILADTLHDAISSSLLFNIYTADRPTILYTSVANFSDTKVIYTPGNISLLISQQLQNILNLLANFYFKCKIEINNEKSSHIIFTLNKSTVSQVCYYFPPSSDILV